ncbi:M35 family metallo-endopeptidase [Burkholderia cenocepacia]|uniref:Metallo peptidase, family M35 n=2 Tax=Burkholderia cenocepacia TaxID=95486 RepID=B4ELR1_BURCJ|nr:M35 family metallo-endopeptidase [Burkholderia cenocepacia]KIS52094.1 lysine-specific metallo-endopeptidase family protein [Burkholderia cepacia]KKI80227.1 peptidase M35 [Burkholderia cenocepacia]ONR54571.1 peptidase M35 [Burkholderia cenocepacia]ONR63115.1 peptidase M35 [Burkholderia cenocepacia]ONR73558.1 peptidase M35 [Burkholderia cenocepacia]
MKNLFDHNKYDFDANEDKEWFLVHSGAVTNTNPGSMVDVYINTTPICPNMTNRQFRITASRLLKWSIILVERRITDLKRYDKTTKDRMIYWFNRCDENTRQYLLDGFSRHLSILKTLTPHHFVRSDPNLDRMLGCVPNMVDIDNEAAHVCGPNTERRLISIAMKFCTGLRDQNMFGDSSLSTVIHEVTHFVDTFGSGDPRYGLDPTAAAWARANPDQALRNADTLTGFVIYGKELFAE